MFKVFRDESERLKNKIIQVLEESGFKVDSDNLILSGFNKGIYREVQRLAKMRQIYRYKEFLINSMEKVRFFVGMDLRLILRKFL